MRRSIAAFLAALILMPLALKAEMDIAPPIKINWNGFIQHWFTLAETTGATSGNTVAKGPDYNQTGSMLKRFRIRMGAEVYDGINVVLIPELAGTTGFTLLDGYVSADLSKYLLDFPLALTVTLGQFKTPFGLNRMYTPPQLAFVNYSGISNNVFGSTNFWDDGLMLTYVIPKLLKVDVAVVEGLGPNQATATTYNFTGGSQDYAARAEWTVIEGLAVGGSVYNGEYFTGNGGTQEFPYNGTVAGSGRTWTGAHLQYKTFGKGFQLDAEMIARGSDRTGYSAVTSYYLTNWLQLALGYDRVVRHDSTYGAGGVPTAGTGDMGSSTRYQAGLNLFPGGTVRLSLDQEASATGPDESLRPGSAARTILQTQVTW